MSSHPRSFDAVSNPPKPWIDLHVPQPSRFEQRTHVCLAVSLLDRRRESIELIVIQHVERVLDVHEQWPRLVESNAEPGQQAVRNDDQRPQSDTENPAQCPEHRKWQTGGDDACERDQPEQCAGYTGSLPVQ